MSDENPTSWTLSTSRNRGPVFIKDGRAVTEETGFGGSIKVGKGIALILHNVPSALNPETQEPYYKSGRHQSLVHYQKNVDGSIDFTRSHPDIEKAMTEKGFDIIWDPTEEDMDDISYDPAWSMGDMQTQAPSQGYEYIRPGDPARKKNIRIKAEAVMRRRKEEAEIAALSKLIDSDDVDVSEAIANENKKRRLAVLKKRQAQAEKMRAAKAAKEASVLAKANTPQDVNDTSGSQNTA